MWPHSLAPGLLHKGAEMWNKLAPYQKASSFTHSELESQVQSIYETSDLSIKQSIVKASFTGLYGTQKVDSEAVLKSIKMPNMVR